VGKRARFARHPNQLWETHVDQVNQVWVGDISVPQQAA
jgi:hypothetical protein